MKTKRERKSNEFEIGGRVTKLFIPAGRKMPAREVLIDTTDYELVNGYRWCLAKTGYNVYVVTNIKKADGSNKTLYLHRLIMGNGEILRGKKHPDHINGDTMDNRRSNLRLLDPIINTSLGHRRENKTSKYRGVHYHTRYTPISRDKRIVIRVSSPLFGPNGNSIVCKTETEGAMMYDLASVIYFGKKVISEQLNFPEYMKEYKKMANDIENKLWN